MQCWLQQAGGRCLEQELRRSWQGEAVLPPFFFSFLLQGEELVFRARREAPALVHPAAQAGRFCAELWRYDVVEFFIATPDASRYLEFNLCPNGAWWAAGFSEPRVALPGFEAESLRPRIQSDFRPERWACEARLPLHFFEAWGWGLRRPCRMAACAVLCREGGYTYLTTSEQLSGAPDFHRPWDWEAPLLPD